MTALSDLMLRMDAVRKDATFFTLKRRKDGTLYILLGQCLCLCEDVEAGGLEQTLRTELASRPLGGRNRTFVERGSDTLLVVCRYVFERGEQPSEANRQAAWRYCAALREARKRQIRGADLAAWMVENGGVHALFSTRPTTAITCTTKTLHLTTPVVIQKGGAFILRLQRTPEGAYDVLEQGE